MSLNQAFQTAVAYRQGMIDRNMDAAAQAPMLAIQALNVGLQAQAQSQQAQFQMQSMVLGTQLQIEETKAKQAMQVMEFDLKQRQIAADQIMARQNYDLNLKRTNAAVAASDAQSQAAQIEIANARAGQDANNALGVAMANGMTMDDLVRGKGTEYLAPLQQTNPLAFAQLGKMLGQEKEKQIAGLSASVFDLNLKVADAMSNSRLSPGERAIAMQAVSPLLKQQAGKLSELTGQPVQTIGDSGIANQLAAFSKKPGLDADTAIKALAEIRQTREGLDPEKDASKISLLDQRESDIWQGLSPVSPPVAGEDPATTARKDLLAQKDAALAQMRAQRNITRDPEAVQKEAAKVSAMDAVGAWESAGATKASNLLTQILSNGTDPRFAEAQRLKHILDAAVKATRADAGGRNTETYRPATPSERKAVAAQTINPLAPGAVATVTAAPGTRIYPLTKAEMEAMTKDPSFENVQRILSRLEVK